MSRNMIKEFLIFTILIEREKYAYPEAWKNALIGKIFWEHSFTYFAILSFYGYYLNLEKLLNYTFIYFIGFVILYDVYEIFYILNDAVFVRFEDIPTIRSYVKEISIISAIIARMIYYMLFFFFLCDKFYSGLIIATVLVSLAWTFHNFQKLRINRAITFPLLRLTKYLFVPLFVTQLDIYAVTRTMILLLPIFHVDILHAYQTQLRKHGYQYQPTSVSLAFLLGIYLPLQLVLIKPYYHILVYNCVILIISFVRNVLNKLKNR